MKTRSITLLLAVLGISSGLLAQTPPPEPRAPRARSAAESSVSFFKSRKISQI